MKATGGLAEPWDPCVFLHDLDDRGSPLDIDQGLVKAVSGYAALTRPTSFSLVIRVAAALRHRGRVRRALRTIVSARPLPRRNPTPTSHVGLRCANPTYGDFFTIAERERTAPPGGSADDAVRSSPHPTGYGPDAERPGTGLVVELFRA